MFQISFKRWKSWKVPKLPLMRYKGCYKDHFSNNYYSPKYSPAKSVCDIALDGMKCYHLDNEMNICWKYHRSEWFPNWTIGGKVKSRSRNTLVRINETFASLRLITSFSITKALVGQQRESTWPDTCPVLLTLLVKDIMTLNHIHMIPMKKWRQIDTLAVLQID